MKTKTTGTHHCVIRPHSDANHSNEKKTSPVTPCMDMYVSHITTYWHGEEKANQYFKIYADMRTMDPLFSLNDLIALRDILTKVIDNEKKAKEIKAIINFRNKK